MKEFSCGVVVPGCPARFEGETEDAILVQVARHAHDAHGMEHVPDDVIETVRSQIREVN